MLWPGFQVPHAITIMAKGVKRVYLHAVSLIEIVRTYGQTLDLVEKNKGIEWLVAEYRNESQRMIGKGVFFSLLRFLEGADDDGDDLGMNPLGSLCKPV